MTNNVVYYKDTLYQKMTRIAGHTSKEWSQEFVKKEGEFLYLWPKPQHLRWGCVFLLQHTANTALAMIN